MCSSWTGGGGCLALGEVGCFLAAGALSRGYNAVSFDGPGKAAACTTSSCSFQALLQFPGLQQPLPPRMAAHGLSDVQAYLRAMRHYTLAGLAGRIQCPALVFDSDGGQISPQQGQLFGALRCQKHFHRFTSEYGADGHTHPLAQQAFWQQCFDFLDITLPNSPDS